MLLHSASREWRLSFSDCQKLFSLRQGSQGSVQAPMASSARGGAEQSPRRACAPDESARRRSGCESDGCAGSVLAASRAPFGGTAVVGGSALGLARQFRSDITAPHLPRHHGLIRRGITRALGHYGSRACRCHNVSFSTRITAAFGSTGTSNLLQAPSRAHPQNLHSPLQPASDLTVRCNFEHRSSRSSQVRRFPLTRGTSARSTRRAAARIL